MTLAHPAAVLPLRRLGLPMTALAAGSMVPDIPVFLGWVQGYELSHSLLGVLTADVAAATLAVMAWFLAMRDAVVDMAPAAVRSRLPVRVRPAAREWLLVPVAACLGAGTHVLWDAFTHEGRWGPEHIGWLREQHGPLPGLRWVQYASGVVGLAIVVWAAVRHLRSLPPVPGPRRPPVLPAVVLPAVVGLAAVVGLVSAGESVPRGFRDMAFNGVVDSLITVTALGLLACAAWHALRLRAEPE